MPGGRWHLSPPEPRLPAPALPNSAQCRRSLESRQQPPEWRAPAVRQQAMIPSAAAAVTAAAATTSEVAAAVCRSSVRPLPRWRQSTPPRCRLGFASFLATGRSVAQHPSSVRRWRWHLRPWLPRRHRLRCQLRRSSRQRPGAGPCRPGPASLAERPVPVLHQPSSARQRRWQLEHRLRRLSRCQRRWVAGRGLALGWKS
mmetsp:Transcript_90150/g.229294  ORF Transcript_90150/g.229294 Transcript_90150/m.229294 type:complete len:200 (+) Transcript_90150:660-1259(+)